MKKEDNTEEIQNLKKQIEDLNSQLSGYKKLIILRDAKEREENYLNRHCECKNAAEDYKKCLSGLAKVITMVVVEKHHADDFHTECVCDHILDVAGEVAGEILSHVRDLEYQAGKNYDDYERVKKENKESANQPNDKPDDQPSRG